MQPPRPPASEMDYWNKLLLSQIPESVLIVTVVLIEPLNKIVESPLVPISSHACVLYIHVAKVLLVAMM